jgi:hypothetical protein
VRKCGKAAIHVQALRPPASDVGTPACVHAGTSDDAKQQSVPHGRFDGHMHWLLCLASQDEQQARMLPLFLHRHSAADQRCPAWMYTAWKTSCRSPSRSGTCCACVGPCLPLCSFSFLFGCVLSIWPTRFTMLMVSQLWAVFGLWPAYIAMFDYFYAGLNPP